LFPSYSHLNRFHVELKDLDKVFLSFQVMCMGLIFKALVDLGFEEALSEL